MRNDTYLYTDGLDAARRSGQIALWRASHQANIACKKAIEDSIRQGFDGVHLKEDCAKEVLEEFGFKRVNWVTPSRKRVAMTDSAPTTEVGHSAPSFRKIWATRWSLLLTHTPRL